MENPIDIQENPTDSQQGIGFPAATVVKDLPINARNVSSIPELGRSLEKEMATHPSIFAWVIPWAEEPGRLQSMEL